MELLTDVARAAAHGATVGIARNAGEAFGDTISGSFKKAKNDHGNISFCQNQNENITEGTTNCYVARKRGSGILTFNQNGRWRPDPPDKRSYLYKLVIPRFNLTWTPDDVSTILLTEEPGRRIEVFPELTTTMLQEFEALLGNVYRNNTLGTAPEHFPIQVGNYAEVNEGHHGEKLDPFKIIQWQCKYIVKNVTTMRCNLTIYDYIARRDTNQPVEALMKDYFESKDTNATVKTEVNTRMSEIDGSRDNWFLQGVNGEIDPSHVLRFGAVKHHVNKYWRLMRKTTVSMEPGAIIEYVQSMYNVKVRPHDLTIANDTENIVYMEGKSRYLIFMLEGQTVSGPPAGQSNLSVSDAKVLIERFKNVTLERPHMPTLPHVVGYPATKAATGYVFKHLTPAEQNKPNENAEAPVTYEEDL